MKIVGSVTGSWGVRGREEVTFYSCSLVSPVCLRPFRGHHRVPDQTPTTNRLHPLAWGRRSVSDNSRIFLCFLFGIFQTQTYTIFPSLLGVFLGLRGRGRARDRMTFHGCVRYPCPPDPRRRREAHPLQLTGPRISIAYGLVEKSEKSPS